MDQDQAKAIKNARGENKNSKEELREEYKTKKIDLNNIGKKEEKIGRHFYIREELDEWLNSTARKTNNTKSDLIEIAIEMLKENAEY